MKHVLMLGAGLMQGPAINAAHELGCKITVIDGNFDALYKDKADRFEQIDLKDTQRIINFAITLKNQEGLSAVFTAGTDFSYAVASAAKACNLPGHSPQSAKNASDKIIMRSCFAKDSVPSPQFIEVSPQTSHTCITNFLKTVSYPLVVKPCDNMGGRGCRLVRNNDELKAALTNAIQYSKTSRAIVEEYMEGPEFSIDSLIFDGELTITGFADRHIFYPPYFIEMGHTMPTTIDTDSYKALLQTFAHGITSLGLQHGAAKADIKLTPQGPMIGEIAARLSGGYMSGWTYPYASNIDLTKQALLLALGEEPTDLKNGRTLIADTPHIYNLPCSQYSAERAWLSIPGTIQSTEYVEQATKIAHIKNIFPRVQKGDKALFPVNNIEKAGNVISCAKTRKEACEAAERAVKTILLRLQPDNNETKTFLEQALDTSFPPSAFNLPKKIIKKIATLPENTSDFSNTQVTIPDFLKEFGELRDWNGRTLIESITLFNNSIHSKNPSYTAHTPPTTKDLTHTIDLPNFWHCLIRGGIQGALYYADTKVGI